MLRSLDTQETVKLYFDITRNSRTTYKIYNFFTIFSFNILQRWRVSSDRSNCKKENKRGSKEISSLDKELFRTIKAKKIDHLALF